MRNLIFGLFLTSIISCKHAEFCGDKVDKQSFSELNGDIDFKGKSSSILMQLAFETKKVLGEESDVQFEVEYDKNDIIVMNIFNISDESSAKKISCLLSKNKSVNSANTVYVLYKFNNLTEAFKY